MKTSTDSGSADESEAGSSTSTIWYGHEPYESFQHRALALLASWPGAENYEMSVERLKGGGYNRIIGLTRERKYVNSNSNSNQTQRRQDRYILRIPRYTLTLVENHVAAFLFVRLHTEIPAPLVYEFDKSSNNLLGRPFMVQDRLPGLPAHLAFSDLSHDDRCRLATELGIVVRQMLSVRSRESGTLVLSGTEPLGTELHVKAWYSEETSAYKPASGSSSSSRRPDAPQPVYRMIVEALEAWIAHELRERPDTWYKADFIREMIGMASEMDGMGYFDGLHFSLAHLDLHPRNIMVRPSPSGGGDANSGPIISGILDWDSAILAPTFMSCEPPDWLWNFDCEDEDGECSVWGEVNDRAPNTKEGRQLKELFERAAGPGYTRFARPKEYSLARRLMRLIVQDIKCNEVHREAEAMLEAWTEIYRKPAPADTSIPWRCCVS